VKNNTPSTPLGDSQRRRDRAGEARAKAEAMIDPQSKKLMIRGAQAYEQLAEWAQIELWKGVITVALTWRRLMDCLTRFLRFRLAIAVGSGQGRI
jgi:hypothetical protein